MAIPLQNIIPVVVIVGFAALIYSGGAQRAPDRGTQVSVEPTKHTYVGIRNAGDRPEATLVLRPPTGDPWSFSVYDGGLVYQERTQAARFKGGDIGWTYDFTVHRYFADYSKDLGTWVGFRVVRTAGDNPKGDIGLDVGIRYSPVRLAYGVLSPDFLISPRQIGIGISAYPPSQSVSPFLQHLGIGVAYLADYRGGAGLSPYLSLSTRF